MEGASLTIPLSNLKSLLVIVFGSLGLSHHVIRFHPILPIVVRLGVRRLKDTLNGLIQRSVEVSIGLLGREPFCQGPGKACDNTMILAQAVVGLFPRITTRQRNYPQAFGMFDEMGVEVVLLR